MPNYSETSEPLFSVLPLFTEEHKILDDAEIRRARALIDGQQNGHLSRILEIQAEYVERSAVKELEQPDQEDIILNRRQLRGIIYRALIHGAVQSLQVTAETLKANKELEEKLSLL